MKAKITGTLAIIAIAVIGVLVFVFSKSAAVESVSPFQRAKVSWTRKVSARLSGMWNGAAAKAENLRLKSALEALAVEGSEYSRVVAENERLRAALEYERKSPGRWIVAEVLSFGGGDKDLHTLILDLQSGKRINLGYMSYRGEPAPAAYYKKAPSGFLAAGERFYRVCSSRYFDECGDLPTEYASYARMKGLNPLEDNPTIVAYKLKLQ